MTYINRFVIEEESQFECDGVFRVDFATHGPPILRDVIAQLYRRTPSTTYLNELLPLEFHVFISADFSLRRHLTVLRELYKLRKHNPMVTCIGSERLKCIQKEEYETFYNEKGRVRYAYDGMLTVLDVQKSIGDGVEDFFQLIQIKTFHYSQFHLNYNMFYGDSLSRDRFENLVKNFHISMLTEEKQNAMLVKQNSGENSLDFANNTKLSENEHNYALSICFRKTCKRIEDIYYEIIDPSSTALTILRGPEKTKSQPQIIQKEKVGKKEVKAEIPTSEEGSVRRPEIHRPRFRRRLRPRPTTTFELSETDSRSEDDRESP